MSNERYAYNLDGGHEYGHEQFETREAAITAGREEAGEPLATVWTCRVADVDVDAVCRSAVTGAVVSDLLDFVSEAAGEIVGASCNGWPHAQRRTDALKASVACCLAAHLREVDPPTFYHAADIIEHETEAE